MTTDGFLLLDNEPHTHTETDRVYNLAGFRPKNHLPERLHRHANSVRHLVYTIQHDRFCTGAGPTKSSS